MERIDGKAVVMDVAIITHVSVAVVLMDNYTNKGVIGKVQVFLKELSQEAILNPSGYFLFLNISDGIYTLRVESEHYLDEELMLSVPPSLPENPVVTIFLRPRPSYPFPPGATLVRGLVRDGQGHPVAEAHVDIVGKDIDSRSDERGEFVLYFRALKEQDVVMVHRKRLVKGNGEPHELASLPTSGAAITIRAIHPHCGTATATIEVEEGTTAFVSLAY